MNTLLRAGAYVQAIKTANRQFVKDEEQNTRQNSWRSFQAKPKKRVSGS